MRDRNMNSSETGPWLIVASLVCGDGVSMTFPCSSHSFIRFFFLSAFNHSIIIPSLSLPYSIFLCNCDKSNSLYQY